MHDYRNYLNLEIEDFNLNKFVILNNYYYTFQMHSFSRSLTLYLVQIHTQMREEETEHRFIFLYHLKIFMHKIIMQFH